MFNFIPKSVLEEEKMIFPVPPGHVRMKNWNIVILEYQDKTVEKFLGLDVHANNFRISSQIITYDPKHNTGRTISGSIYEFMDKPGKLHISAQPIYEQLFNAPDMNVSLKYTHHYDA